MVVKQHGRQEYAEDLPQRHDDCKDQRTVGRNHMENENLTGCRRNRKNDDVPHEGRVPEHECYRRKELTPKRERPQGEEARKQIHPEHHLKLGRLEVFKQCRLVVARKTVKHHVSNQQYYPRH